MIVLARARFAIRGVVHFAVERSALLVFHEPLNAGIDLLPPPNVHGSNTARFIFGFGSLVESEASSN